MIKGKQILCPGIIIPGDIPSSPRPRFDFRRKRAYMPRDYKQWQETAVEHLKTIWTGPPLDGAISFSGYLIYTRPKSKFNKKNEYTRIPRITGGDLDNEIKSIWDALQLAGVISNDSRFWRIENFDRWWGSRGDIPHASIQLATCKNYMWPQTSSSIED